MSGLCFDGPHTLLGLSLAGLTALARPAAVLTHLLDLGLDRRLLVLLIRVDERRRDEEDFLEL